MSDSELLEILKKQGKIWPGNQCYSAVPHSVIPTSYPELDEQLPGGGWPIGAIVEILYTQPHRGEVRMILPALKYLGNQDSRWQIWLNPPDRPHGPGLLSWGVPIEQTLVCPDLKPKDLSWTMDQCVQHRGCSVLLVWTEHMDPAQLRRLQLTAENRRMTLFLFRKIGKSNNLPYPRLKLRVSAASCFSKIRVDIIKRRPGWPLNGLEFEIPMIGPDWRARFSG